MATPHYLPDLVQPIVDAMGLDKPFWDGALKGELWLQRCNACSKFQWGPEWICHRCRSFDLGWAQVPPAGTIYSWERPWHPVHPALKDHGPYLIVLVELPQADGVRLVGNLLGDPTQEVRIGARVAAVFEKHADADPPFALVQWRLA